MSTKSIFLVGATGFVGRNLCKSLLDQGHRLLCLVRGAPNISGPERLRTLLGPLFPARTLEELQNNRLEILEGDITRPGLGLEKRLYQRLVRETDEIWHCAALLSFDERHQEQVEACNVAGTRRVLELARACPGKRFHYLSTVYVAGRRQGLIKELGLSNEFGFKNPYEKSKWQAEKLVTDYDLAGHIKATIYRPSIIIGDTKPGSVCSSGVYRVARIIVAIAGKYALNRKDAEPQARLRIVGSRDCGLNLVPIDYVVKALSALAPREDTVGRVFHLVNPRPMPNEQVVGAVGDAVGLNLELADRDDLQAEPLTGPDLVLAKTIRVYLPYLRDRAQFDAAQTTQILEGTDIVCPVISRDRLARLLAYSQAFAGLPELAEKPPAAALSRAARLVNLSPAAPLSPPLSQV